MNIYKMTALSVTLTVGLLLIFVGGLFVMSNQELGWGLDRFAQYGLGIQFFGIFLLVISVLAFA